ncbi:MAG: HD domain-containing protein, partial [Planctomycetes bacterium]|nr:HD domain-containing protein [Planctomycetota bacterium]
MPDIAGLTQIPTSAIRALVGEGLAQFEVYLPRSSDNAPVLYRKAGSNISLPDFDRMAENGVHYLYVGAKDFHACEQALESQLGQILANPGIAPAQKAEIVHTAGQSIARQLIQESVTPEGLIRTTNIVNTMIDSVLTDTAIASHLLDMAGHERSTASHMFIVSALAILLGAEVFGADQEMLRSLGVAGMLHDLGKLSIPSELLNKATPLTREEAKLVQQHPIESVRLIGDDPHVTPETRQMILQHHERVDGRGYPLGLPDSHLLPATKVLSIVDSFHAMIGRRSYRLPVEPDEANRIMKTQVDKQFDAELLSLWEAVCTRCSSETVDATRTRPTVPCADEVASRHEHRPTPSAPSAVDRRPARFECRGNATVACVHAGRLVTGASSPP